jgi:salicylate hydroxylase
MTTSKPFSIAIVGGGISGLCLAIGLLHHSQLKVSIFEASPAFTEIGAGLALGPNAQRALRLISHVAEQAFRDHATGNSSPAFSKAWFDFRCDVQGTQDGLDFGIIENETGQQTVHRAKFLDALASLVPEDMVHFGKRLVRVTELEVGHDELVLLHFADGTTSKADCVIGADGIHSPIRKHLLGAATAAATPVFSGIVAYRGLIPMETASEVLGKYAHDAYVWCGNGGMVMTYPINSGQVLNVVAACERKSWNEKTYVVNSTAEQLCEDFESWGGRPREIIKVTSYAFPVLFFCCNSGR